MTNKKTCEKPWLLIESYKYMYRFTNGEVIVIVYGNLYRNVITPKYSHFEFFNEFICDDEIYIDITNSEHF